MLLDKARYVAVVYPYVFLVFIPTTLCYLLHINHAFRVVEWQGRKGRDGKRVLIIL